MGGKFNNISLGANESKSHFGAWAITSSPMILGMDVTNQTNLDIVWPFVRDLAPLRTGTGDANVFFYKVSLVLF